MIVFFICSNELTRITKTQELRDFGPGIKAHVTLYLL